MSASGEHIDYQALYQASELRNNQLAEQVIIPRKGVQDSMGREYSFSMAK